MIRLIRGTMSIIFMMFIVPVFGQGGMSVSILEYPQPFHFSSIHDFVDGVKSTATISVSNFSEVGPWDLMVSASGDLTDGNHSIPISTFKVKAKKQVRLQRIKSVNLAVNPQVIARKQSYTHHPKTFFLNIDFKTKDGKAFLKPAGNYSTELIFTLVSD